jgi:hypothetical protein
MQNLSTGDFIQFLLNPEQMQTQIQASYASKSTIGGSHQWLQYTGTSNVKFNITATFSMAVHLARIRGGRKFSQSEFDQLFDEFEDYRRFLMEFMYPRGKANDPLRRSPPTCLLLWPKHVAMVVVVRSLSFQDKRFNQDQRCVEFAAQMQLEEYRQHRLTSTEARKKGFRQAKAMV